MIQNSAENNIPGWLESLREYISTESQHIPEDILSTLRDVALDIDATLPPRVFYEVVQQSAVAISITDPQAKILYANDAFVQITGYHLEDIIHKNESILSDKRTPKHIYQGMWQKLVEKKAWSGELINRRKNGERYIAQLTIVPVVGASGDISHYLGMHRDVTEQYRLSKEVNNHKRLIESVVDAAPVIIALLDEKNQVVRTNVAYEHLKKQLQGREPAALFWGGQLGAEGKLEGEQEIRLDLGGNQDARWFSCSCTQFDENDTSVDAFFETSNQTYRLLVAKEITDIKREQEAVRLNALKALMAEEELVQSIREALSGSVYQLQGPLNMVSAASNMLEIKGHDVDMESLKRALQEALEAGMSAIKTLKSCIPNALEEVVSSVNINEIIHEVLVISTERLLNSGIVVDWKPVSVLSTVNGRESRLRAMFKQLVDNAIDAMSDRLCQRRELTIRTQSTGQEVLISICDSGPGISEKDQLLIFQPFYTTKGAKGKHSGMGLSMVQDIVSEHSGSLTVARAMEGGCKIEVQLPVSSNFRGGAS